MELQIAMPCAVGELTPFVEKGVTTHYTACNANNPCSSMGELDWINSCNSCTSRSAKKYTLYFDINCNAWFERTVVIMNECHCFEASTSRKLHTMCGMYTGHVSSANFILYVCYYFCTVIYCQINKSKSKSGQRCETYMRISNNVPHWELCMSCISFQHLRQHIPNPPQLPPQIWTKLKKLKTGRNHKICMHNYCLIYNPPWMPMLAAVCWWSWIPLIWQNCGDHRWNWFDIIVVTLDIIYLI